MNAEARVASFVLRFVYEQVVIAPEGKATDWYSVIRHIQSDTERRFTRWEDVVEFMSQYVDLYEGDDDVE